MEGCHAINHALTSLGKCILFHNPKAIIMSKSKWFITGASGGLGMALTKKVLAEGHPVTAAVRRPATLQLLKDAYSQLLTIEQVDVTDQAQLQAAAARNQDADIIVNNAGGAVIGAMEELSEADIQQQITLNLLAPIHVTRAFLAALRAKKSGTFIHISSMGGRTGFAGGALYHAAKFGLEGFAEAVNQEIAEFGIKTIIIEPGSIKSDFVANIHWTQETEVYKHAGTGQLRNWIKENGDAYASGDPVKMAEKIYQISQMAQPPLRTVLGADAYQVLEKAYTQNLHALQQQKDLAESVAFDGKGGFIPQ